MTVSPATLTSPQQRHPDGPTRVAVVIPAFRAAGSVGGVIESIPELVRRIIVVDDACPEGTGAAAAATGDARVEVLRHARNEGVGGAVLTGLHAALVDGAGIVVKIDADGQMDPAEIPRLIAPLLAGEADYAKGNRWRDSPRLRLMPLRRRLGNLGLSLLAKAVSGRRSPEGSGTRSWDEARSRLRLGIADERRHVDAQEWMRIRHKVAAAAVIADA